jgi:hypothetical protein
MQDGWGGGHGSTYEYIEWYGMKTVCWKLPCNVFSNACSCSDISTGFSFPSYLILHCFDWFVHSEAPDFFKCSHVPQGHPQTQLWSTKMSISQHINIHMFQSTERCWSMNPVLQTTSVHLCLCNVIATWFPFLFWCLNTGPIIHVQRLYRIGGTMTHVTCLANDCIEDARTQSFA